MLLSLLMLGACGGSGAGAGGNLPPAAFTVGGSVTGLAGSGLRLQNNGSDDLDVAADGTFTFTTSVIGGTGYSVAVAAQPNSPAQRCVVSNGNGTASAAVTNVTVSCFNLQTVALRRRAGGTQYDLFVIREDGANPVTIADSTDEETFGGVAAGERVIFRRDTAMQSDIYSIKLDGTGLVTLANDASLGGNGGFGVPVTPNGKVVFSRKQSGSPNKSDLFIVDADGANEVQLTNSTDNEAYKGATASGRVIFSRTLNAGTVNSHDDLYSIKEDGTGLATLADTMNFEEFQTITPGGRVVFARIIGSQRDLYSVNADGTGMVALSTSPLSDEFHAVVADERILFRREPAPFQFDLYGVKADGTGLVTLANSADMEFFAGTTPDGKVIFSRRVGGAQSDVYIVNADGTGLQSLANTANDEFFGGVTAAGRIIFGRSDGSQYDLYAVNADGSNEQRLTNTPENEFINCGTFGCAKANDFITPSGRIIFVREPVGGFQTSLHSINADGTGEVMLAADADYLGTTASGRLIFSRASGDQDIFSINDDGTDEQILADTADLEAVEGVF